MQNANSSKTDFFTLRTIEAYIHQQKAFTKALNFRHFNLAYYIHIKNDALGYVFGKGFSQMTLFKYSFHYVTYEDPNFSKSKIG